ncbi:PREDICTED: uncharacterized protein LOC109462058 [Branchiostoma belcheri]|uniref:Uncharacterized protein LOC109462058 n=1 Tax=Branchiostoma belcheri TaxID=7741 RepID=A0A6P4XTZ9_BRABE|nr:PREDICTED: uncharacterized protein LOC109462058 [Branchiostoma belcheri]
MAGNDEGFRRVPFYDQMGTTNKVIFDNSADKVPYRQKTTENFSNVPLITQRTAVNDGGLHSTPFYNTMASTTKGIGESHTSSDNNAEKVASRLCPAFCCHLNISCVYNAYHDADCACANVSSSDDDTCRITQSAPRKRKNSEWERVMHMRTPVLGVCISSQTPNTNNTEYKLHCHIEDIDDFTYSISGTYNGSARYPGYKPCLVFVHVNASYPELEPRLDKAMGYIGVIALGLFAGFICVLARQRDGDK